MFGKIQQVHFVGIGGIGMSGIAELLLNLGFRISGSDLQETEITKHLQSMGATIFKGHNPENIKGSDMLVYSSAVHMDNPEIQEARKLKIPIIRRAEMLSELIKLKLYSVAVAGTHGKTTTTSLIGSVLTEAGLDPTLIVGGVLKSLSSNTKLGEGDYIVVEADEFDRSFLMLSPTFAIITTIETEHLDCYANMEEIQKAFIQFANKVPFYGAIIVCIDEKTIQDILPNLERRVITYGFTPQADIRAEDLTYHENVTKFSVIAMNKKLGEITLHIPGSHNVLNAMAAIALSLELDIPFNKIQQGLKDFSGVRRRFEIKSIINNIMFVDDYAHHPTEIIATLKAAKSGWNRRIVTIFQPHLYTRTRNFYTDFGRSFFLSDILILTDVYPAREEKIEGISGELIANAARQFGQKNVHYIQNKSSIPMVIYDIAKPGDMVIAMGAGDIWKILESTIQKFRCEKS
jgi:UDP-N-acetylmuramate--alanine ligase